MVIVLEKELAALFMQPGDDVKLVLDKIKGTYARMAAAGSKVSQMQQCTKIISVLDNSWDNLIPTLNTQQDQWTPEWLRGMKLQEAAEEEGEGEAEAVGEALAEGEAEFVAAASGALLPVIGVGNAKVIGANGELVGLGNVLLVEGLSANLLSARQLQKSKAKATFGPTSCRAKLGKLLLWNMEEKSSCIKDLWQLAIIPWIGKPPATAAAAATAKATAGGEETGPTDGALDAVKKVQQPQQSHGEELAGVDGTAAWAKASSGSAEADWETWHESLLPKEKRGKLETSGRWGVHLGIAKDHKGWLLWDSSCQVLTVSRDVKFLESLYYKEWKQQQQKLPTTPPIVKDDEVQRPSRQVEVSVSEEEIFGVTEDGGELEVEQQQQQHALHPSDHPKRDVRPPARLTYASRGT
ncbi:unnamed protein product [Closterium sp. NIES-54]